MGLAAARTTFGTGEFPALPCLKFQGLCNSPVYYAIGVNKHGEPGVDLNVPGKAEPGGMDGPGFIFLFIFH